jgi:integrase
VRQQIEDAGVIVDAPPIKARKIGLEDIRALKPNSQIIDAGPGAVTGFGARRRAGTAISYFVMFRPEGGKQRLFTIGQHGAPWTPDTARKKAFAVLSDVKLKGADPSADKQARRDALTMAELFHLYMEDAEAGRLLLRNGKPKKPLTLASDRGRIIGHMIPLMGHMAVAAVTKRDVDNFMHKVGAGNVAPARKTKSRGVSKLRGGKGVATRSVGLLGAIFSYAIDHGMRADNPAHRIRKFAENKRDRRLSDDEYLTLGAGLRRADGAVWPAAVACFRFLLLSGWRSGEAVGLRWRDVDLAGRVALLPDTKTGVSVRPLSHGACDILQTMARGANEALVFPATRDEVLMSGFKKFARRIVADAGLPADVTPHILRHSFATLAASLGYSEPTIGVLIGHKGQSITSRYIHLAADPVLQSAADVVSNEAAWRIGEPRIRNKLVS